MATKQLVERKLRELIKRLAESGPELHGQLADSMPEPRVIRVLLPDIGATYWTRMSAGRMGSLSRGDPEHSDITVTLDSNDLVELVDGKRSLFSSYLAGRVKIDANLTDLLRLRRLA